VIEGQADAGLGLEATAERLGAAFVSCGEEPVRVFSSESRRGKPGVEALASALDDVGSVVSDLPGYDA
jgi:molybdate-binding protein